MIGVCGGLLAYVRGCIESVSECRLRSEASSGEKLVVYFFLCSLLRRNRLWTMKRWLGVWIQTRSCARGYVREVLDYGSGVNWGVLATLVGLLSRRVDYSVEN